MVGRLPDRIFYWLYSVVYQVNDRMTKEWWRRRYG